MTRGPETPAQYLRRMAPTRTHEGRRAFLKAADDLDRMSLLRTAKRIAASARRVTR